MKWEPEQDLEALLNALTQELLRAFEHEVAAHSGVTADAADAVRRMVANAEAGCATPPVAGFPAPGLRDHIGRIQ